MNRQKKKILKDSILSMTEDEDVNWPNVRKKVADGDITYTLALAMAQRKIQEYEDINLSEKALKYMPIFRLTRILSYFLFFVYMMLSFFQKPSWCLQKPLYEPDRNSYYDNCAGTALEGTVIPVSDLPYLSNWAIVAIELFCVTFLTFRKYLQQLLERNKRKRFMALVIVTVVIYIADVIQYSLNLKYPLNQFLRPIYMLIYVPAIKVNLLLYVRLFWKSREIFVTIAGAFLFYVCVGRILFYQTAQNTPGTNNFDTFANTLYNLFVALTTSNYPDVMMPIYKESRVASLYFIFFMATVGIVLLNIILAYFYYNYKKDLLSQALKFQKHHSYHDIINEPDSAINVSNRDSAQGVKETKSFPKPSIEPKLEPEPEQEIESDNKDDRDYLDGLSNWRRKLIDALDLFSVQTVFALGSLLTFLLVIIETEKSSPDPAIELTDSDLKFNHNLEHYWALTEFFINCFLLIEPFLRVIAIGWKHFINSKSSVFDFILSIVVLFLLSLRLFVSDSLELMSIKILLVFRMCRFLMWVNSFEEYKLIFSALFKLVPLFSNLLGVLFFAFYVYTTIGTAMFGGHVKTNANFNFAQAGDPQYYVYVNFNDFFMGMFTCFHLLIVNNWLYTVDVHCKIMGNYLYRIYFVSFYIITVAICLNIMISFILDIFVVQIAKQDERYDRRYSRLSMNNLERRASAKLQSNPSDLTNLGKRDQNQTTL